MKLFSSQTERKQEVIAITKSDTIASKRVMRKVESESLNFKSNVFVCFDVKFINLIIIAHAPIIQPPVNLSFKCLSNAPLRSSYSIIYIIYGPHVYNVLL